MLTVLAAERGNKRSSFTAERKLRAAQSLWRNITISIDMPFGLASPRKLPEDQEVSEASGLEPTHDRCVSAHDCVHLFISAQLVGESMSDNFQQLLASDWL